MNKTPATERFILIIEDSEDDYEAMTAAFQKADVNNPFIRFRGGREALDYLKQEGAFRETGKPVIPGLILLDLNMPGIDGRKVLQQLKADAELKKIPVVVLTTSSNDRDISACYEAGANAYIVKPLKHDEMVEAVRQLRGFWFETAVLPRAGISAAHELAELECNRGWRYQVGFGAAQDYVQAYVWYSRAAANGSVSAADQLKTLSEKLTPEQLAEAKHQTRK